MNRRARVAKRWWRAKRYPYNKGLVIAGFTAFLLYCILGPIIIAPHEEFEETIFEMVFQGGCYFFMMILANIIYSLGWIIDITLNKDNSHRFRAILFNTGYWFSFSLPVAFILWIMSIFLFRGK